MQNNLRFETMIKTKEEFQERYIEKSDKPLQMLKQSDINRAQRLVHKYINSPSKLSMQNSFNTNNNMKPSDTIYDQFQKKKIEQTKT